MDKLKPTDDEFMERETVRIMCDTYVEERIDNLATAMTDYAKTVDPDIDWMQTYDEIVLHIKALVQSVLGDGVGESVDMGDLQ